MKPKAYSAPQPKIYFLASFLDRGDKMALQGYAWRDFWQLLDACYIDKLEHAFSYVSCNPPPRKGKVFHTKTAYIRGTTVGLVQYQDEYVHKNLVNEIEATHEEISTLQPDLIVPIGDLACWAVTGQRSSTKWRGSITPSLPSLQRSDGQPFKVIPLQEATILPYMKERGFLMRTDLKRIVREQREFGPTIRPDTNRYIIWPTFQQAKEWLNVLLFQLYDKVEIACDIEMTLNCMYCIGFAYAEDEAICIPFLSYERPDFYTEDEAVELLLLVRQVLAHPNAILVGQNFNYDRVFFLDELLVYPKQIEDTMQAQHILLPGTPKGLDILASLYVDRYQYWKDERKEAELKADESIEFEYNCKDCTHTLTIHLAQKGLLEKAGRKTQSNEFQQYMNILLETQTRGIPINKEIRLQLIRDLAQRHAELIEEIDLLSGFRINPFSSPQVSHLFYTNFGLPVRKSKTSKGPSTDADTLPLLGNKNPLLVPLINRILEIRSNKELENVLHTRLTERGTMPCFYKSSGTYTYRLSAAKDPYGRGWNVQTITAGEGIHTAVEGNK